MKKFAFFSALLLIVLLVFFSRTFKTGRALELNVLAITSFNIVPDNREDLYIGSGFSESVITKLSAVEGLHLIEREQLERAKKRLGLGADEIITQELAVRLGELVNADIIILGTIQTSRDKFKVTTKTMRLRTDEVDVFISDPVYLNEGIKGIEEEIGPFYELQEDIARNIAGIAGIELTDKEMAAVEKDFTDSGTACVNYMKGRDFYVKYTVEDNDKAIECFLLAVEADPSYALSYAGLGDCYAQKVGAYKSKDVAFLEKAVEYGKKAVELDPALPEGYKSLGISYTYKGFLENDRASLDLAMENYEKALNLNPYYVDAHLNMARIYLFKDETDKAGKKCEKALELDYGYSPAHTNMAYVYIYEEEYKKAIEEFEKVIEIEKEMDQPESTMTLNAYVNSGYCYGAMEDFDSAMEQIGLAFEIDPNYPPAHYYLGALYAGKGEYEKAKEELEIYLKLEPEGRFVEKAEELLKAIEER